MPCKFLKVAVLGACLAAGPVFAGPVGSLILDGSATIHIAGSGSAVEAQGTHTVFANDQIETGPTGARLVLQDGSVVTLGPASRMAIRAGNGSERSIELIRGRLSFAAQTEGWSIFSADSDPKNVSAGSSMEFGAQTVEDDIESGELMKDRRVEPAPRPRSLS